MAGQAGARGFWRGFLTGVVGAAVAGLVLAWRYPPVPAAPPDVDPAATEAPGAPDQPGAGVTEPAAPAQPDGILPAPAPAPLVDVKPEAAPGSGPGSPSLTSPASPSE